MLRLAFLVLFALFSVWALFQYSKTTAEPTPTLEIQDSEILEEPSSVRASEKTRGVEPLRTEETYNESNVRPLRGSGGGHYGGRGGRSRNIPKFAVEIADDEIGSAGEERSIANPIRHGSPSRFDPKAGHVLGEVNSKAVYRAIPEFKQISDDNVERGSALWARLMKQATLSFKGTMRSAASEHKTPLIIELGRRGELGLEEDLKSLDLTAWCIRQLQG